MTHEEMIQDFLNMAKLSDTTALFRRAEEAMNGMLVLNGTGPEPVFVGFPPRWHENPCGVAGYTWTISRLAYMATLCKAFLVSGKREYLDKVEVDLADWFSENPAPPMPDTQEKLVYYHGIHNWRMLEVGYRMIHSIPVVYSVLSRYSENRALLDRIRQSIAEHAERIDAASDRLWPARDHNHYTEEICGLLSAASMIPEHPMAQKWAAHAMEGIETACEKQLSADGAQVEGAPLYHNAVVINLCCAICSAEKLGLTFSPAFVERVRKGTLFSVQTISPNGTIFNVGDSSQLDSEPIRAGLIGAMLFGEPEVLNTLKRFVPPSTLRQVMFNGYPWGFPGMSKLLERIEAPDEGSKLLPTVNVQRAIDQVYIRSAWNRDAACLYFSCHSPIHHGDHAHMDQLGVIYGAYGKIFLQDPGRYTYKDCEDRHLYKSSAVHNVPTVDGRDAFEYIATFKYGPQQPGSLTGTFDTDRLHGVSGRHENYTPVICSRTAAILDDRILLIADTFEQGAGHRMEVFFHMDSTKVTVVENGFVADCGDAGMQLVSTMPSPTLLPGRISDVFYHDYPSTRASFVKPIEKDRETVIFAAIPYRAGAKASIEGLCFEDGLISFTAGETSYRIAFRGGVFEIL